MFQRTIQSETSKHSFLPSWKPKANIWTFPEISSAKLGCCLSRNLIIMNYCWQWLPIRFILKLLGSFPSIPSLFFLQKYQGAAQGVRLPSVWADPHPGGRRRGSNVTPPTYFTQPDVTSAPTPRLWRGLSHLSPPSQHLDHRLHRLHHLLLSN